MRQYHRYPYRKPKMRKVSLTFVCQIYLALVLLVAAVISPLHYLVLALVLLLIILFSLIRPQPPRIGLVMDVVVMFLAPLVLAPLLVTLYNLIPLASQIITVVLVLPVFYLLDSNLRDNARHMQEFTERKGERNTTPVFISLLVMALTIILIALVVSRSALLFTGIAFALYLLGVLLGILFTIPRHPFTTDTVLRRIIVGTTGSTRIRLNTHTISGLHGRLNFTVPWARVEPQQTTLHGGDTKLEITFTPPLAGESRPPLHISAIDPRGLIQINQLVEPLNLHIIPKATYAEWLATKYLEQTGSGVVPVTNPPSRNLLKPLRRVDYMESRTYQPGDILRDIDWKHTLKLSQLIVREYEETNEQAAIITVNLSVTDAEAADNLAFNLITVALTLARERIPTLLAVYDHENVVLNTSVIESTEMVNRALLLIRDIKIVKFADRYLEPSDIAKIRRNIRQLQRTDSEPAQRLLDILNFEHRSIEQVARNHPATLAMIAATRKVSAPAMILLVSQLNHDAEAVLVTAEKLARMRFTTLPVASG